MMKVDKIRKAKYKQARLKGQSIAQSLRDSGYSEATARKSSANKVAQVSEPEIMAEISKKDITVDWVVKRLTSELSSTDCKASDRIRIAELLGKYLKMFSDNNIQQTVVNINDVISDLRTPPPEPIDTLPVTGNTDEPIM